MAWWVGAVIAVFLMVSLFVCFLWTKTVPPSCPSCLCVSSCHLLVLLHHSLSLADQLIIVVMFKIAVLT